MKFAIGDVVYHHKFGQGRVEHIDGQRVRVAFAFAAGMRTVLADFLYTDPAEAAADAKKWEAPPRQPPRPPPPLIAASPFTPRDPFAIPRRQWLYGHHLIRKFVSATIAPGGVGKSSLVIVEALAMVTGKPLLGIAPRKPLRVWLWSGEDPIEETERRIAAAMLHYKIDPDDIGDRLFVDSGRETPIVLAEINPKTGVVIARPLVEAVVDTIARNQIDVMSIDPFVSSHRVGENDNNAIDAIVKEWARIAGRTESAIELVHHARKTGGNEVTTEDSRGASALVDAAREARALNPMSKKDADGYGIEGTPRRYFRADNGKANMAPPPDKADWYHLRSVSLGNGTPGALVDDADHVGVVETWTPPAVLDDVTGADVDAVLREVRAGSWREHQLSPKWVGYAVAKALSLDLNKPTAKAKVKGLLRVWIGTGALHVVQRQDEKRMMRDFVVARDDDLE